MASPIQIVLNDRDYQQSRDAGGGGPKTDFFADHDKEFRQHKSALISQLNTIADSISEQAQGDVGYLKVFLRRSAWAKSHRPLGALFKPDRINMAGGGDLGEMFFEARPRILRQIAAEIAQAENDTRLKWDDEKGKDVPNPSPPTQRDRGHREDRHLWTARPAVVLA